MIATIAYLVASAALAVLGLMSASVSGDEHAAYLAASDPLVRRRKLTDSRWALGIAIAFIFMAMSIAFTAGRVSQ